jgi:4-hydroxybenzoate polyprenyltransferase
MYHLLRKIFATFRAHEWWSYKIPPVFAIGYATSYLAGVPLSNHILYYGLFLIASILAAIYVSSINDYFDIDIDLAAGKRNRLAAWKPNHRRWWLIVLLFMGAVFSYFFIPKDWSLVFYGLIWFVFTLYSMPPFRLKERSVWGVWCDALGAHGFATLFMLSAIASLSDYPTWNHWWWGVFIWAFSVGLRGILWHQYLDRHNDLATGTRTFAVGMPPHQFKSIERGIVVFELGGLGVMLYTLNHLIIWIFAGLYVLLVYMRYRMYHQKPIWIINYHGGGNQVLMIDYYQVFLPWSILILSMSKDSTAWMVALLHFILFPTKFIAIGKDSYHFIKYIIRPR